MTTVVYQTFRTTDVPAWIERCMASVRKWAQAQGFEYRFLDDSFFQYAPEWYRSRVQNNILLVSDLARLVLAKELLDEGWDRAIWVDADVLVFAPERLRIEVDEGFAFCRELWLAPSPQPGQLAGTLRVNNAVSVFAKGNRLLDFYIDACERIVRNAHGELNVLSVGTRFLTDLHRHLAFPLIEQVGLFSPVLMRILAEGHVAQAIRLYRQTAGSPIHAANLCASFRNTQADGVDMSDALYSRVIDNLLSTPTQTFDP